MVQACLLVRPQAQDTMVKIPDGEPYGRNERRTPGAITRGKYYNIYEVHLDEGAARKVRVRRNALVTQA